MDIGDLAVLSYVVGNVVEGDLEDIWSTAPPPRKT